VGDPFEPPAHQGQRSRAVPHERRDVNIANRFGSQSSPARGGGPSAQRMVEGHPHNRSTPKPAQNPPCDAKASRGGGPPAAGRWWRGQPRALPPQPLRHAPSARATSPSAPPTGRIAKPAQNPPCDAKASWGGGPPAAGRGGSAQPPPPPRHPPGNTRSARPTYLAAPPTGRPAKLAQNPPCDAKASWGGGPPAAGRWWRGQPRAPQPQPLRHAPSA